MGRTRIKICGIKTLEAALAAVAAGADAVGFVFVEQSPRHVTPPEAAKIVTRLPAWVTAVGLFVDESADHIRQVAETVGLHSVQLHGKETPKLAADLSPWSVVKALPAGTDLSPWAGVNAVLIDTPPANEELPGGAGRVFDWTTLQIPDDTPPVVLAGGLTSENVGDAIRTVRPYGVDVSTGVERERGIKDPALIAAFCAAVRKADASL